MKTSGKRGIIVISYQEGMILMNTTPLAKYLKMLRESKGLKQEEVAEYLSIGRGAYSHYENARNLPSLNNLVALSEFYGIPVGNFTDLLGKNFEETGNEKPEDAGFLAFLNECSYMNGKDLAKWMTLKDRELVYYYHELADHDKKILMKVAKAMVVGIGEDI